ncbi:MAG: GTP-binding protein [Candidatus Micrarchaeaceae archaeon]
MDKYIITMLGEKDHGKSTLIGNLLISTGNTTEARIAEVKKTSKSKRFEPAHILDSFSEERDQEMTIDTTRAELVYKKAILELIDVPGHLELIKNMMSGASNSDIAILMVSVKPGEGFRPQTKRHIFLSSMFGIKALVVAINKMDSANYDKDTFDKAKSEVSEYLKSIGFGKPTVCVPISAYNNENLVSLSKNMPWYRGKPLLDVVREFAERHSDSRHSKKGLRIFVQDSTGMGDGTVFGVLYNGRAKVGDRVRVEPDDVAAGIRQLYVKGKKVRSAKEGTNVAIAFDRQVSMEKGSVIYGKGDAPHRKGRFAAKMFIISRLDTASAKGLTVKISNHNLLLKGLKIKSVLSPISGKENSKNIPKSIDANNVVYAEVSLDKPYPVERYADYSELGRFAIYDKGDFIGVGVVE